MHETEFDTLNEREQRRHLFGALNAVFEKLSRIEKQLKNMPTLQDIQTAIANAATAEIAEIARYAADLAAAIASAKLPDGSVVLSATDAQALIDSANGIADKANAADPKAS